MRVDVNGDTTDIATHGIALNDAYSRGFFIPVLLYMKQRFITALPRWSRVQDCSNAYTPLQRFLFFPKEVQYGLKRYKVGPTSRDSQRGGPLESSNSRAIRPRFALPRFRGFSSVWVRFSRAPFEFLLLFDPSRWSMMCPCYLLLLPLLVGDVQLSLQFLDLAYCGLHADVDHLFFPFFLRSFSCRHATKQTLTQRGKELQSSLNKGILFAITIKRYIYIYMIYLYLSFHSAATWNGIKWWVSSRWCSLGVFTP